MLLGIIYLYNEAGTTDYLELLSAASPTLGEDTQK
jgi:hypothetical protein